MTKRKFEDMLAYEYSYDKCWLLTSKDAELLLGILSRAISIKEESYRDENGDYKNRRRLERSPSMTYKKMTKEEIEEVFAFEATAGHGD